MGADAEAIYLQLSRLAAELPDLSVPGPVSQETNKWLGKVTALIEKVSEPAEVIGFRTAVQFLDSVNRPLNAQTILAILFNALARAELSAPLSAQGAFVHAGATYDVFVAFGKVLATANSLVMIVDPYADEKALSDFAILAPEGVPIRILADAAYRKPSLKPASERWIAQYGAQRPLEIRLAPKGSLHDRLIVIDRKDVWTFGQSLNAIAARAHTSIVRTDPETAALKVQAYDQLWADAAPIG